MQSIAIQITGIMSHIVEIIAAIIIGMALLRFLLNYSECLFGKYQRNSMISSRIEFGSSVAMSLELLLAADVLATAVAPSWNDIGQLAAIAIIRTLLNYFLERELSSSKVIVKS